MKLFFLIQATLQRIWKEKGWGFYTKDGYIDNETYLENKLNKKKN